ncbi:iron complex transport system permease protein [Microbacteriaceae bacterium SG_E_30_P1]|uniref:Iron complex transport system permease protein n=1 Tax=Antiquaquibacter oligotrophicus TaxID=2880260 RepID=A0ABT6KT64_9MICO|nr:iron chelate uptake ABC transporter family permease subunit [Antiquaquibacter oligotrophicus]MDH6182262.1 iron complex transport system permease protein [Antiquaquibacter oligotrophicus]UDF12081.1 iron chelate uptake ABC transporter family permease subunit [Antiquaquibacter oligotrophicus]
MTAVSILREGRTRRLRRQRILLAIAALAVVVVFATTLMVGDTVYPLSDVIAVLVGVDAPGAFTIGELRLPRATLGLLAGVSFGMAGVSFQTLLRNPLASPDVIGITAGASAAGVVGIVVLGFSETQVSLLALAAALLTAGAIYLLSHRGEFSGIRLILIGIGIAAMLDSLVAYVLSRAAQWNLQVAMQWLTGSLNGAGWSRVLPVAIACVLAVPVLIALQRPLGALRLGDDSAASLGVGVQRTRLALIVTAVCLLAVATASTGPIAFVAFMSGPIAARIWGAGANLLLPAGAIGALLVLCADLIGQFALDNRYPVGVITGALGAPYLIYLLIRMNRKGSTI